MWPVQQAVISVASVIPEFAAHPLLYMPVQRASLKF